VSLLVLLVAGELFARFYLGLGDPPLSEADSKIEYLFKPDQDCHRRGANIRIAMTFIPTRWGSGR
jgi:hypothetical protein